MVCPWGSQSFKLQPYPRPPVLQHVCEGHEERVVQTRFLFLELEIAKSNKHAIHKIAMYPLHHVGVFAISSRSCPNKQRASIKIGDKGDGSMIILFSVQSFSRHVCFPRSNVERSQVCMIDPKGSPLVSFGSYQSRSARWRNPRGRGMRRY